MVVSNVMDSEEIDDEEFYSDELCKTDATGYPTRGLPVWGKLKMIEIISNDDSDAKRRRSVTKKAKGIVRDTLGA